MQQPSSPEVRVARATDYAQCRGLIRQGSKSFFLASLLLPEKVREPAYALYAFCRLADDAVDEMQAPLDTVERLRERLDAAYAGRPLDSPADRAFAEVVARYGIPKDLPAALLEGFEWDAEGRRYDDLAAVRAYGIRVAGSVGAMMALLMGARDPAAISRACDLGVAMQLTNIARDVGEDARAGRLYLPQDWMLQTGLDPDAWLAEPVYDERLGQVVARLLAAAEHLYRRSEAGIADLPAGCRPGIYAARYLYAEIGRTVEKRGYDSVTARAVVPKRRRLPLMTRAVTSALRPRAGFMHPALAEARHLVEAVVQAPAPVIKTRRAIAWWDIDANVGRGLEILGELEARQRAAEELESATSTGFQTLRGA